MLKEYSQTYPFELPELTYDFDALEPHVDAETMEIHHDKHHAGYVAKLNTALEDHKDLHEKTLKELLEMADELPENIRQAVINNGGGHANHSLFWNVMTNTSTKVGETLEEAINKEFKDFDGFKDAFVNAATTRFGSGWAWLLVDPTNGSVSIDSTANQDSPLMEGKRPILGIDVWEHAYYLKYQNKRPEYIEAWLMTVDWQNVTKLYHEAHSSQIES